MTRKWIAGAGALLIVVASACGRDDVRHEAAKLTGGDPDRGVEAIGHYGCAACHTIPGIPGANATIGPSLDRIASRPYLARQVPNTPDNMMRWIQSPRQIKRDTAMPEIGVTDRDAHDIAAYLYTLR
jgi:cytochrome c2